MAHCGTLAGGFPCLDGGSHVPVVDSGLPQLVPEMGGPWGIPHFPHQVGMRAGSCCAGVLGQAGHAAAPLR